MPPAYILGPLPTLPEAPRNSALCLHPSAGLSVINKVTVHSLIKFLAQCPPLPFCMGNFQFWQKGGFDVFNL